MGLATGACGTGSCSGAVGVSSGSGAGWTVPACCSKSACKANSLSHWSQVTGLFSKESYLYVFDSDACACAIPFENPCHSTYRHGVDLDDLSLAPPVLSQVLVQVLVRVLDWEHLAVELLVQASEVPVAVLAAEALVVI